MTAALAVDEQRGYARFDGGRLPGFVEVAALARGLRKTQELGGKKSYLRPLLTAADLARAPSVASLSLDEAVLAAAEAYLHEAPVLRSVQIFHTPVNDTAAGSQKAHFDHIGERQLKMFVYLNDVGAEDGPFCFCSAQASAAYKTRQPRKGGRFDDVELPAGGEEVETLAGPAGTAILIDTTRCLHFGGRARRGERIMLVAQYVRPDDDAAMDGLLRPTLPAGVALSPRQLAALRL
jgi:hypothetical protein